MKRVLLVLATATALMPFAAAAQAPSQTVSVNGEVDEACVLGSPTDATLSIGTLTGPDGRLLPTLASSTPAVQTTIANAWCNTPSSITLRASPLTMVTTPAYAQSNGFARSITYTANLTGWSDAVTNRPLTADNDVTVGASSAQAADPSMGVTFSNLTPLIGGSENANAFIEAGSYSATVQVTLTVAP